jgi:hypothetical protein
MNHRHRHSRRGFCSRRRGYVLLIVLLVLAIAGAVLAGVCRMSLERALFAERAQADLQRRWGVVTCQSVLLPKTEGALLAAGTPSSEARRDLHLGGQLFSLVFGDEQAKANVNMLFRDGGLAGAERRVREVAAYSYLRIELRPLPDVADFPGTRAKPGAGARGGEAADPAELPRVFEAFGQVFVGARPADLVEAHGSATAVTATLTCWGDGSLSFRRASPEAVRAVCAAYVSSAEISRLLDLRAKDQTAESSDLLDRLKLSEKSRDALDQLIVDDSSCRSLWIISRSAERNWYDLAVSDESAGDSSQSQSVQPLLFSW